MHLSFSHSVENASAEEDRWYARSTIVLTRHFLITVVNMTLKMEQQSLISWFSVDLGFEFSVRFGDKYSKEWNGIVALNFHSEGNSIFFKSGFLKF